MRHDRAVVFAGAFGSLLVMSVLSAGMGRLLPSLIPKSWTQLAAAGLFLVFGVKMLFEAREMKGGSEKMQEEMREVEEEIEGDAVALEDMEEGVGRVGKRASIASLTGISGPDRSHNRSPPPRLTRAASFDKGRVTRVKESVRNFLQLLLGPVFVQSFIMTFLGEWGDRSQIATIALAAAHVGRVLVALFYFIFILTSLVVECIPCNAGDSCWACMLYGSSCHWWSMGVHEDLH